MKQVVQSLTANAAEVVDVPCPTGERGQVLLRSRRSLISAGTERMLAEFGQAGWIGKVRQQPDKVRLVLDKMKTDGIVPTVESVLSKLDRPLPVGYCNVGVVLDVGDGVTGFAPGARVVSNGQHAEAVRVPANLCANVPDEVSDDEAAFTVLGAVALQGIRLVEPTLGESVVVVGLGMVGLLAVQLLRAHGCRVLGIDMDPARLELARRFGVDTVNLHADHDPVAAAQVLSRGRGVDAVVITASTRSNEPVHQAALMCRKRGRIVLVGVTGLELSREDFYEKELSFQVSCSYGPGRNDPEYEEKGHDYPIGFVRWTAQRNFEAVLDMMADGRLDVEPLISHRFAIDAAEGAYALLLETEPSLGILLEYPTPEQRSDEVVRRSTIRLAAQLEPGPPRDGAGRQATLGFVGAGNYATGVLIPAFKRTGARLKVVASGGGVTGVHAGRKFGFQETTTDTEGVFADADVNVIAIATRHESHAQLVCQALRARKHVFVEKPLALTLDELSEIRRVYTETAALDSVSPGQEHAKPILMVGFNRRFAPYVLKTKALLEGLAGPKALVMTVNAGAVPQDHWTQDADVGGGRIVGEACHFIDLLRWLVGAPITSHSATPMKSATTDTVSIQLGFSDGSIGTIHYFANGNRSFPKERVEVFAAGRILQLDNFRRLTGFGWPGLRTMRTWRQDKGQQACAGAFVSAIEHGRPAPIPFDELMEVSRVSVEIAESVR